MRVAINYVTFARDFKWLEYSLKSFRKYCTGFSEVVIVVPTHDLDLFLPLEKRFSTPECPVWIKTFLEYPGKGFVHHLAMKCYADVFSPTADMILHMDPDCLWSEQATPNDYIIDGKPVLVIESYELLNRYFKERAYWKIGVDETLRVDAKFETMCRHPSIHLAETYKGVRDRVEKYHQTPFIDYYVKGKNSFPQNRSEFPVLGAFAVEFLSEKYCLWDCSTERDKRMDEVVKNRELKIGHPPNKIVQFWSYNGTEKSERDISKILA